MSGIFKINRIVSVVGLVIISGNVFAHANLVEKDNFDSYSSRNYQEGKSAYLNFNLAHGCRNSTRTKFYGTKHVTSVFPNSNLLSGVTITKDRDGNKYAGNVMMSIKPSVDPVWDEIKITSGTVPEFYSHGATNSDVRGIQWIGGKVPYEMYSNLQIKTKLPVLQACVTKLKVYVPLVQYCENGQVQAWLKKATPTFPAEVISAGYAPYFNIIRNKTKNPLPKSCNNVGETVEVYPTEDDIEQYLPLKD